MPAGKTVPIQLLNRLNSAGSDQVKECPLGYTVTHERTRGHLQTYSKASSRAIRLFENLQSTSLSDHHCLNVIFVLPPAWTARRDGEGLASSIIRNFESIPAILEFTFVMIIDNGTRIVRDGWTIVRRFNFTFIGSSRTCSSIRFD